jgi:multicomponent Na+:H+ antiporter subunit A
MALGQSLGIFVAIGAPFIAAAVAPLVHRVAGHRAGWVLALAPVYIFVQLLGAAAEVSQTGVGFVVGIPWVPSLRIDLSYLFDGLSIMFGLLISGIGALIVVYAGGYLKGHPHQGRFFSYILLFMGAMLGLVLADDLITLFIYWELTSITSFLLIGFDHTRQAARRAAFQALVITGGGGLVLLAGFILLMLVSGQTSMSGLLLQGATLKDHALYLPILILILGGAFTKSAQFPFHFWLPNAMEAPTPVSAYLHSATMVKAGVYLLMRVHPILGDTIAWSIILPLFGGVTLLVGTILALRQTDLKMILAYTTVASLGLLVMLIGTSLHVAIQGATLYLFAHALFKGCLFMVAGVIDHATGTRDITRLGGLMKAMPLTFLAAFVAAWSMGGLPLSIGFVAKETMYQALAFNQAIVIAALITAIIGNALMFAAGFAVACKPFFGPTVETPKAPHEGPVMLILGPIVLSALGIISVFAGQYLSANFLTPMAFAISRNPQQIPISQALHLNLPLALSALTIVLGLTAFWQLDRLRRWVAQTLDWIGWGPDLGFDQAIRSLVRFSTAFTRLVQPGRLDIYISVTFSATAAALVIPMLVLGEAPSWPVWPRMAFYEIAILLIAVVGLYAMLVARTRLIAIVSLGIQGFAVALIFLLFGAPDLSFTQFMVETLSVVILALVMTRLNLVHQDSRSWGRALKDGTVAVVTGGALGAVLLAVTQQPFDARLSDFFAQNSRVIAHGRNIVNVIIVDFRGLDTLGEIAVVMVAGLAILALVRIQIRQVRARAPAGDTNKREEGAGQ